MQTEEQLHLVTMDLFEQLRKDGLMYAGIRFAPLLHTEGGLSARQVVAAFQYARDKGIPFTAHVGETRGIENVRETLEHFAPSRLGHGVCSFKDPELLEHLRKHNIHIEACPTSNVQTNCYETYADHPIDRLYRNAVSIGVNTDTRTISNITLSQEFEKLHQTFGWEPQDFLNCNRNALEAAFIPDDVRSYLLDRLEEGFAFSVPKSRSH